MTNTVTALDATFGVLARGIEQAVEELLELAEASRLTRAATDAPAAHLTHT